MFPHHLVSEAARRDHERQVVEHARRRLLADADTHTAMSSTGRRPARTLIGSALVRLGSRLAGDPTRAANPHQPNECAAVAGRLD